MKDGTIYFWKSKYIRESDYEHLQTFNWLWLELVTKNILAEGFNVMIDQKAKTIFIDKGRFKQS